MYSTHKPSGEHLCRLKALRDSLKVIVATTEEEAKAMAPKVEIILGHRYLRQCLAVARRLRWVQSSAGGVDQLPCEGLASRGILLTRTTLSSSVIARHAITLAWALTRGLPQAFKLQASRRWDPAGVSFLSMPRQALVLGMGCIGRTLAAQLRSEGLRVIGVKRTLDESVRAWCDDLRDTQTWQSALPEVDWCFVALPLTETTRHFVDETVMRALPAHAVLVNVGRGEVLDTEALIRVLNDGHLGGVALDVVEKQPLHSDDSLWQAPRLLITPYVAAHEPNRAAALERFFESQVQRYLNGEPLEDVVVFDKQ